MKKNRLFTGLYILALVLIVLYVMREEVNIPAEVAPFLYYGAIGIFLVGLVRVFYLVLRKNK
jgi:hypothetical protein